MLDKRLAKQLAFILEADKEKDIFRVSHTTSGKNENDAEHAWHMALMIYLLREYANEKFDVCKAMLMAIIHDIVEIDAGDTYAYDSAAIETQAERENAAAKRIFGILPHDQAEELTSLWHEFECGESVEARFVRTLDNLQPIMLNDYNDGSDWRARNVSKSQIYKRNEKTQLGSEKLWEYIKSIIDENIKKDNIQDK